MKQKKIKKLTLKKVTILNLEEASRIAGGSEGCTITEATYCCTSNPGSEDDSCMVCPSYDPTCGDECQSY